MSNGLPLPKLSSPGAATDLHLSTAAPTTVLPSALVKLFEGWIQKRQLGSPPSSPQRRRTCPDQKTGVYCGVASSGEAKSEDGPDVSATLSPVSGWVDIKNNRSIVNSDKRVKSFQPCSTAAVDTKDKPAAGPTSVDPQPEPEPNEDQLIATLRQQLAITLGVGHLRVSSYGSRKHDYLRVTATVITNTTPLSAHLTDLTFGTGIGQRQTNAVKFHSFHVKLGLALHRNNFVVGNVAGAGAVFQIKPCMLVDIFCDRLPITPGTPPPRYNVDTNPPTDAQTLYTGLGAPYLANEFESLKHPTLNPLTITKYTPYHHIGQFFRGRMIDTNATAATPGVGYSMLQEADETYIHKWYYQPHRFVCQYSGTSTAPLNNNVYVVFATAHTAAMQADYGGVLVATLTIDTEFEDLMDDL